MSTKFVFKTAKESFYKGNIYIPAGCILFDTEQYLKDPKEYLKSLSKKDEDKCESNEGENANCDTVKIIDTCEVKGGKKTDRNSITKMMKRGKVHPFFFSNLSL